MGKTKHPTLAEFKAMPHGKQQAYADLSWGWLQLSELRRQRLFETSVATDDRGLRHVLKVARAAGVLPSLTALRDTLVTKISVPEDELEAILRVAERAITPERRRELLGEQS